MAISKKNSISSSLEAFHARWTGLVHKGGFLSCKMSLLKVTFLVAYVTSDAILT